MFQSLLRKRWLLMPLLVSCGPVLQSGRNDGKTEALEDKSWFRNGKDRVYLAYTETKTKTPLDKAHPDLLYGHHLTFVVGCFGEPANPAAKVKVSTSYNLSTSTEMALNERTMLQHFPIEQDYETAKRLGKCAILVGSPTSPSVIANSEANTKLINSPNPWGASAVCASAALATIGTGASILLGTFATTATGSAAGWLSYVIIGGAISGTVASIAWCGGEVDSYKGNLVKYLDQKNKPIFIEAMVKAANQANIDLNKEDMAAKKKLYHEARAANKLELALAVYTPIFVKAFNQKVDGKFEQGWGWDALGGNDQFFRALKGLETLKEPDANAKPLDGGFFNQVIHCQDPKALKECAAEEGGDTCWVENCVTQDKIILGAPTPQPEPTPKDPTLSPVKRGQFHVTPY